MSKLRKLVVFFSIILFSLEIFACEPAIDDKKEEFICEYSLNEVFYDADDWSFKRFRNKDYETKINPKNTKIGLKGTPYPKMVNRAINEVFDEKIYNGKEHNKEKIDDSIFIDESKLGFIDVEVIGLDFDMMLKVKLNPGSHIKERNNGDITSNLTLMWKVKSIYGETKLEREVKEVNNIGINYYPELGQNVFDNYVYKVIKKGIKNSFENFITSKEFRELDAKGILSSVDYDNVLTLAESNKKATKISEAMSATVTILSGDEGHGSGFFVDNSGHVITNYHVIARSKDKLKVKLNNGKELDANIVRANELRDLALLKVDLENEFSFLIPENENYELGLEVYAVGTPKTIELGQSVTKGILSGTRKHTEGNTLLQTDVSVNSGNSGGPLIDNNGNLLGVVSAKLMGFGVEGISFAIPANKIFEYLSITY